MTTASPEATSGVLLQSIEKATSKLEAHFSSRLSVNRDLTRALVSFQANKTAPGYRWFKFKEGFSSALVEYVFNQLGIAAGAVIDPFAGSGSTLFTASARGLDALGMEILPVGCAIIRARRYACTH